MCVCVKAGMEVEAKRLFRCFAFIHSSEQDAESEGWIKRKREGGGTGEGGVG